MKISITLNLFMCIASTPALAGTFKCTETAKSKAESNIAYSIDAITVESSSAIVLEATKSTRNESKHLTLRPQLGRYSDQQAVRFVETEINLADSDSGETGIFVSRSLLNGKPGTISVSSNQINEGDSGSKYLWFTEAVFACE